ncbi:MAG: hypothetical protein CMQ40_03440 [Gammaproteobacteria bacterium]|nr:hypothetical protein [Gammaproteobacteria bacterium]
MNSSAEMVLEVNLNNFQAEVVDKSQQLPVLVEFYAEQAEQCASTSVILQKLVGEYQGKFLLRRVEVQNNPQLVQQMQVRALPTVKIVHQGQIAGGIDGPVDEDQLRNALNQLTMSSLERIKEEIDALLSNGDRTTAIVRLQEVIAEEPNNFGLHTELCDLLIMEGRVDEAREMLAGLPSDSEGLAKPKSRLEFIEMAESLGSLDSLIEKMTKSDQNDCQLKFDVAIKLVVDDKIEEGLSLLLAIVEFDRAWEEEKARKAMIKVFDMLGKGNELAMTYRRKMFALLH